MEMKSEGRDNSNLRPFLPPCRVCGDKAAGFHYGVNTCEACKGFFHRSLRRYKEYKCRANRASGYCEYKPGKRKSCQYCRYQRCLKAGMSKDAIKTGRYTYLKRTEDTKEIKRLEEFKLNSDGEESKTSHVSPSLNSVSVTSPDTNDMLGHSMCSDVFMDVDSTTKDDFDPVFLSGSESGGNGRDHSSYDVLSSPDPWLFQMKTEDSLSYPCSPDFQNKLMLSARSSPSLMVKSQSKTVTCDNEIQSLVSAHNEANTTACHTKDKCNKSNLYASVTAKLISASQTSFHKTSTNGAHNSVMYRLLTSAKSSKEILAADLSSTFKDVSLLAPLPEPMEDMPSSSSTILCPSSIGSPKYTVISSWEPQITSFGVPGSSYHPKQELCTSSSEKNKEMSFCVNDQPASSISPLPISYVDSPSQTLSPSDLFSTVTLPPNIDSSTIGGQGTTLLDLDNGQRMNVIDGAGSTAQSLITKENLPADEKKEVKFEEDSVTLQIMKEYTKDMHIPLENSESEQSTLTTVQTLFSSSDAINPKELRPEPTRPSVSADIAQRPARIRIRSNLQPSQIPELFKDKDAVISALMMSHEENFKDLICSMDKEEMIASQKAHCEVCDLRKETFGDLSLLPEKEYDDVYSLTGIDVDNRRDMIHNYLCRMERYVRGLAQFAKSIPGFSGLDISSQVELIKLARSEFAMFTSFRTVNKELGVTLGLCGEQWTCQNEITKMGATEPMVDYILFCDSLQKLDPSQEELVLLKALLLMSPDRCADVSSSLADAIRWELCLCLRYYLQKKHVQPGLILARYIMAITQSRTVSELFKRYIRTLRINKYSTIEQNPLMWEMYSYILNDKNGKEGDQDENKICEGHSAGLWCLLGYPVNF